MGGESEDRGRLFPLEGIVKVLLPMSGFHLKSIITLLGALSWSPGVLDHDMALSSGLPILMFASVVLLFFVVSLFLVRFWLFGYPWMSVIRAILGKSPYGPDRHNNRQYDGIGPK